MTADTPPADTLTRLRDALRDGDPHRAQAAAAPLIARCFDPLLARCDRLVASSRHPLGIDGADLALEAWAAALHRLADSSGEPIRDEEHFHRLLLHAARNRFFDALERKRRHPDVELDAPALQAIDTGGSHTLGDRLVARERAEGDLLLGADTPLLALVEALFTDDDTFLRQAARPPRRAPRQYRALVLFHLAELLRDEDSEAGAAMVRRYAHLLGIGDTLWKPVEAAARSPDARESELLTVVNRLCGATLRDRATLSVLRYELGRLAVPRPRRGRRYNTA